MKFLGMLKSDFKRMFCSWSFCLSVLAVFLISFLSIWPEIPALNYEVSVYYLVSVRGGIGAFFVAMTVVAILPYALSYRADLRHNYIHCLEARVGTAAGCCSHAVVTAVGAFLAIFLGYTLFFGLLAFRFPIIRPGELGNLELYREMGMPGNYESLILSGFSVFYFAAVFATEGMGYAFLAVFTLMVSVKVENVFLLLCVPIMAYYGSMLFCSTVRLPDIFWWFNILRHGAVFGTWKNAGLQFLGVFFYFGSLICLEGLVFVSWAERRHIHG